MLQNDRQRAKCAQISTRADGGRSRLTRESLAGAWPMDGALARADDEEANEAKDGPGAPKRP